MTPCVFISDLHLCPTPPVRRLDNREDFCVVTFKKVQKIRNSIGCPFKLFIAGDVFHRSRDLDALDWLFKLHDLTEYPIYAVRGQHDMVYHSRTQLSVFDIACKAGILKDLSETGMTLECGWRVYGQGYGQEDVVAKDSQLPALLLTHTMVWDDKTGRSYEETGEVLTFAESAGGRGFKAAVTGDNHQRIIYKGGGADIYNLGAFTRRDYGTIDQPPGYLLLNDDTVLSFHTLPDEAQWDSNSAEHDKERTEIKSKFAAGLVSLESAGDYGDKFLEELDQEIHKTDGDVRRLLEAAKEATSV